MKLSDVDSRAKKRSRFKSGRSFNPKKESEKGNWLGMCQIYAAKLGVCRTIAVGRLQGR